MSQYFNQVSYGLSQALINQPPYPIYAKRAPTTHDIGYQLGTLWIYVATNAVYILTSVVSNTATWLQVESSGGTGVFSSLTVTPGPISLTGTTTINTSGAGVTTIGTGGSGAVNIGNASGNTAVTGSLTTTTSLAATTTLKGATVYATGDLGGSAATNALSNAVTVVSGGTGAFTITSTSGAGTGTNAGFIKMYVGVNAVYIPYYTATT
jgi:hypothetical protein